MIIWTADGPYLRVKGEDYTQEDERQLQDLNRLVKLVVEDIRFGREPLVTIKDFYQKYVGYSMNSYELAMNRPYMEPEIFINPEDWGWDKNGFHRLFETVINRRRIES